MPLGGVSKVSPPLTCRLFSLSPGVPLQSLLIDDARIVAHCCHNMLWLAVHLDSYGSSLPRSHAWRDAASCFLLSVRALLKAAQQLMQQLNESDMVI